MAIIERIPALTRRRFITLTAAAAGFSLMAAQAGATSLELVEWQGHALGAHAMLKLYHPNRGEAERIIQQVLAQVRRLERLFNLYDSQSALVMLNRNGVLEAPEAEFVELLTEARTCHQLSNGLFDPSVQPLWQLYVDHFSKPDAASAGPDGAALAAVMGRIGMEHVAFNRDRIAFTRPGMALTLNGIAQGFVTDKAVEILRNNGIGQSLVDFGEIRAVGTRADGSPWRVAIDDPAQPGTLRTEYPLANMAIATSSGYGFRFAGSDTCNHIFDPRNGHCAVLHASVSIIHQSATVADALATAACLMGEADIRRMLDAAGGGEAWIISKAGDFVKLRA